MGTIIVIVLVLAAAAVLYYVHRKQLSERESIGPGGQPPKRSPEN